METDKKRVIHIRLRSDIPYEQHLQRALQDLPHGYIKRVVVQLFRSVVPETAQMMPPEQIRQTLIDVADKGMSWPSANGRQHDVAATLPPSNDPVRDDDDNSESSPACESLKGAALTGLISSGGTS